MAQTEHFYIMRLGHAKWTLRLRVMIEGEPLMQLSGRKPCRVSVGAGITVTVSSFSTQM
jgi:hypothetical protein